MHAFSDLLSRQALTGVARQVVRELVAAHLTALLTAAVLWGLLGLVAGLALAALGFRLLGLTGVHALGDHDVASFFAETRQTSAELVGLLAGLAKLDILRQHPDLRGGSTDPLLEALLPPLVAITLGGAVEDQTQAADLGDLHEQLRTAA